MSTASPIPYHIGIIMDGNGRWASEKGLPRSFGHQQGAEVVRTIVRSCVENGVKALTLFAFSQENWHRPQNEVSLLMRLAEHYLKKELNELHTENIRFKVIGNTSKLPKSLQAIISDAEEKTKSNDRFYLNIALSYSGRMDIVTAVQRMIASGLTADDITEDSLHQHLSLNDLPDPDLIIRTSGEQRLSNFLLWQSAYSELYFTSTLWPDFNDEELRNAIHDYQQRQRRFGKIS